MRTPVSYIPYDISYNEQSEDIITLHSLKRGLYYKMNVM